jgi:hypothetical protein
VRPPVNYRKKEGLARDRAFAAKRAPTEADALHLLSTKQKEKPDLTAELFRLTLSPTMSRESSFDRRMDDSGMNGAGVVRAGQSLK